MKSKTNFIKSFFCVCIISSLALSLSTVVLGVSVFPEEVLGAKSSIKSRMLLSHIDFLASRYCRGRDPGSYGMEAADKYITTALAGAGLDGGAQSGDYFQPVRIEAVRLDKNIAVKVEKIKAAGARQVKTFRLNRDFLPVILSAEAEVTAAVVFAGYGITASEHKYDDYKNLDAAGKIVLVMRHEPGEKDKNSPFAGQHLSRYGTLLSKILNAQDHGAVGILFATDPLNHDDLSVVGGSYDSGTQWPALRKEKMKNHEDFKYMRFPPQLRIVDDTFEVEIPAVMIDGRLAGYLLGKTHSLLGLQEQIDRTMKPCSFPLPGTKVTMDIFFQREPVEAHNIVVKVEGSDPQLKHEVVIVGAHYDHLGKDNRGQVYGGADDNASGTAAVIELARAFQQLKQKPKRTIVFILFTAEEKGLLGSRYYVQHPIFPLEKTLAMINMDMLGRNDLGQLGVIGKYQFPKLFEIAETLNKKTVNFDLILSVAEIIQGSDHFPFIRAGIPCLEFTSGFHDQYHKPGDNVGRIIGEKVEKAAHLVFLTLWEVANLPAGAQLK